MARVKYFVNRHEPDAKKISDKLRAANIDFSCIPTSGPMMLTVDGITSYGPTDVTYAVSKLVESPPEYLLVGYKGNPLRTTLPPIDEIKE